MNRQRLLVSFGLLLLVACVYWQTGNHAFINFDDDFYVYGNPEVVKGLTRAGASWAFRSFHATNWHPLTWLSHMLDVELFGLSPGWHHRMNALYHLLNTEFLFLILWGMTGGLWQSAFVAALFGIHPLHVESVAWVAERKDLLSTLFVLMAVGAYARYVRRPGFRRYAIVAALFALALMCKPMVVTLPFLLLLLDVWPLRRLSRPDSAIVPPGAFRRSALARLLLEKVPLAILSAVSCLITYRAASAGGAVRLLEFVPLDVRVGNALVSWATYLWKTVFPASLAVFYPHSADNPAGIPAWRIAGSVALLVGLSVLAFRQRDRRPYLVVGWLWFLGALIPVIGLVQVGYQAFADRYTYIPLIGVFIAVAWGIPGIVDAWRPPGRALRIAGGASVALLAIAAWIQAGYWRDSVTLYTRSLGVTEGNWLLLNNLGLAYGGAGRYAQAVEAYRQALRIRPNDPKIWNNLGTAYAGSGRYPEAVSVYREALRLRPDYPEAWNNLGCAYLDTGSYPEASSALQMALQLGRENPRAWNNMGVAHEGLGQYPEAVAAYREALRLNPDFSDAWYNLGLACSALGRSTEAREAYERLLRLDPARARLLSGQ